MGYFYSRLVKRVHFITEAKKTKNWTSKKESEKKLKRLLILDAESGGRGKKWLRCTQVQCLRGLREGTSDACISLLSAQPRNMHNFVIASRFPIFFFFSRKNKHQIVFFTHNSVEDTNEDEEGEDRSNMVMRSEEWKTRQRRQRLIQQTESYLRITITNNFLILLKVLFFDSQKVRREKQFCYFVSSVFDFCALFTKTPWPIHLALTWFCCHFLPKLFHSLLSFTCFATPTTTTQK